MKRLLLSALVVCISFNYSSAQLANGSIAPDWTLTDVNGTAHNLYSYLDGSYTVFLDFSAVWCGPCWGYHTSGALEDLYIHHGPSGFPNVDANTTNTLTWDASNVSSGMYFVKAEAAGTVTTQKLMLMK